MPIYKQATIAFAKLLPARPYLVKDPLLVRGAPFETVQLIRSRELEELHSLLHSHYDSTIENLYTRRRLAAQRVEGIIFGEMADKSTARQVASFLSMYWCEESASDVTKRKMAYPDPVVVLPEAAVSCKGLPSFVWKTPAQDKAELRLNAILYGNDIHGYEKELIYDHIGMFRKAIDAQRMLIAKLVDSLSQTSTLDRLRQCLTMLMVPAKIIKRIADQVSQLDCFWKDSIPAEWLTEAAKPVAKPNKDCIIKELGSSPFRVPDYDADWVVSVYDDASSEFFCKLQSFADANQVHGVHQPSGTVSTSSHSSKQDTPWGLRLIKGVAAAGMAVAGLVAARSDPAVHAVGRSWLKGVFS